MTYVSGTATDMPDLITQIRTFLAADGWTIERFDATSVEITRSVTRTGPGTFSRGFGLAIANNTNVLGGGVGYYVNLVPWDSFTTAAGYLWHNQAGHPVSIGNGKILGVAAPTGSSNIPYHFFSDATHEQVVLVFGRTTGVFNYLSFGFLIDADDKYGAWDGWQYCFGSRGLREDDGRVVDTSNNTNHGISIPPIPPGYRRQEFNQSTAFIKVDSDGSGIEWRSNSGPAYNSNYRTTRVISGWFTEISGTRNTNVAGIGGLPSLVHPWVRSRSNLSYNIVTLPCSMSTYRSAVQRWSPICRLPLVRACWTSGALNEGTQFSIGADNYRAFNSFAVQEIAT